MRSMNKKRLLFMISVLLALAAITKYNLNCLMKSEVINRQYTNDINVQNNGFNVDENKIAIFLQNDVNSTDPVNYTEVSRILRGSRLNTTNTYCKANDVVDNDVVITYNNFVLEISNVTKSGTKCYLYFDRLPIVLDMASASLGERTDGWKSYKTSASGTPAYLAGVYETDDTDDGSTIFYYSGDVQNNWVRFGNDGNGTCYYWRIIRTNTAAEGGGVRLLYAGSSTTCSGSVPVMTNAKFGLIEYYPSYDNSSYVGYMFTSGEQHGHGTSSTTKEEVDSWYTSSGLSNFASSINENAIYCNDRSTTNETISNTFGDYGSWRATGTYFSYAAGYRAGYYYNSSGTEVENGTPSPTLECSNSEDKFSKGTAGGGNGYLSTPLALMTVDELIYAGAKYNSNSYSYFYYASDNSSSATGNSYWWTMSPVCFKKNDANVFIGYRILMMVSLIVTGYNRPVVSLKSTISVSGSGTVNDPYVVE